MEESWRARLRMRNKEMKNKGDYKKSFKQSLMPEKGTNSQMAIPKRKRSNMTKEKVQVWLEDR